MEHELYQVDAFAAEAFRGNPAAVCLMEEPGEAAWMQAVAVEMNLSETAFLVPRPDGFGLRWFTPGTEVTLCGHATLASAHTLWETGRLDAGETARFHTLSGLLVARRRDGRIEMELPVWPVEEASMPEEVADVLGVVPERVLRTPEREVGELNYLFELESEAAVRAVRPDFGRLGRVLEGGVMVTARAGKRLKHPPGPYDFASRYFAPYFGIDEDPVTGAAHCSLVPYWCARLGKDEVVGYQASARGGVVYGRYEGGDRVALAGEAVTVLRGRLIT